MANLILKPSSGGVLKLQNDAGTVDALTVSTAGNLTAAGNTTLSGTANVYGAGTFPAGHIIKNHSKTFLGVQTISSAGGNASTDWSEDVSKWVLIGTGASGDSGDPLKITTGTPSSSSSKYLLRAYVSYDRMSGGSLQFKWWYRVAGSGAYVTIVQGQDNVVSANWIRGAFGSDHNSVGSNHGVRQASMEYLWSPGTSNSYDIQIMGFVYSGDRFINRPVNTDNSNYMGNAISTFTVQEAA